MIDTIGLRFNDFVVLKACHLWHDDSEDREKGKTIRYKLINRSKNRAPIKYFYYPYANHGAPFLYIEFSLPRLLLGNNAFMIYDIERDINLADLMLPEIPGVPKINLWEGILTRLDVCYNHNVGDLTKQYVPPLGFLNYSRRVTVSDINMNGVYYKNNQITTKFYVKSSVSKLPEANGILRQETTRRKEAVRRLTKNQKPTLCDIHYELLITSQERDLVNLSLFNSFIGNKDYAASRLTEVYGAKKGLSLYDLLCKYYDSGSNKDSMCQLFNCSHQTIDRKLKKIVDSGLSLTLTDTKEPLPPLIIDRSKVYTYDKEQKELFGNEIKMEYSYL